MKAVPVHRPLLLLVGAGWWLQAATAAEPMASPAPGTLTGEERRLLQLAIGDLAHADLAPAVGGVPQPYPNDVVRYICRYQTQAAPELLDALQHAPPTQEVGYACYCLSLVHVPPQDLPRYRVELGRVHDRLADESRSAPRDMVLRFALHCADAAMDAVAPLEEIAPPPATHPAH